MQSKRLPSARYQQSTPPPLASQQARTSSHEVLREEAGEHCWVLDPELPELPEPELPEPEPELEPGVRDEPQVPSELHARPPGQYLVGNPTLAQHVPLLGIQPFAHRTCPEGQVAPVPVDPPEPPLFGSQHLSTPHPFDPVPQIVPGAQQPLPSGQLNQEGFWQAARASRAALATSTVAATRATRIALSRRERALPRIIVIIELVMWNPPGLSRGGFAPSGPPGD